MIGIYVMLGTICLFAGVITALDLIARHQKRKARKG